MNGITRGSLFAVIREGGARWDHTRPPTEQDAWDEHLAFMGALVENRFVVLGGWLAAAPRTLLVVEARDEAEVRRRFEGDPYAKMELLAITSVEPWEVLLGRELLAAPNDARVRVDRGRRPAWDPARVASRATRRDLEHDPWPSCASR